MLIDSLMILEWVCCISCVVKRIISLHKTNDKVHMKHTYLIVSHGIQPIILILLSYILLN